MKITAIDTCILTIPMQREMRKQFAHHKLVVAEISTDEGVTGLGTTLGFGGGITVTPTFTAYTSPNTSFGTVQELSFKVAHGSKFAPYGLVAVELKGQADGGANKGTYGEFGVAPSWALGGSPVTVAIPVKVGLSLKDYYETSGVDNKFGFVDAGVLLTVPFTRIPSQYGSWNVHGGVNVLGFGDTTKSFNNGDAGQVVVSGGIGMSY